MGSKLRQNQASNWSFLSSISFLAVLARINEIERSQRSDCQNSRALGAQADYSHPWPSWQWHTGPSDPPQLCRGSAGKQMTACAHVSWWGHFHLPFIYWTMFLTLLLGWSLPASSLYCYHTFYFLPCFLSHIYNPNPHQACSILVTCKPVGDINKWRSHMPVFSLRTHEFHEALYEMNNFVM